MTVPGETMREHEHRFVVKTVHAQRLLWLRPGLMAASGANGQAKPMKKYYLPTQFFSGRALVPGVDLKAKAREGRPRRDLPMVARAFASDSVVGR